MRKETMLYKFNTMLFTRSLFLFSLLLLPTTVPATGSFLYFAYGSNLLKERLTLNNPSATVQSTAKLQDYTLVFGSHKGQYSQRWRGGVASIEPSAGDTVWGVMYKINTTDMENLDRQEGVSSGVYSPALVRVSSYGQTVICRTYIMNNRTPSLPSPQYLQVIRMGAKQNRLPKYYQDKLNNIKYNNFDGHLPVMDEIKAALQNSKKGPK
ncbi:gamma-glutamylcyclotransferase [Trichomycterus rosablanca]|uniref:gamma-glutamylcyclotransferase n=1 Tax=Trichomycterus rosablanca TaxID=2290929 RepID=UPI002F35DF6C